ncbi:hypothetical protein NL676_009015 [Syzygium grande]|nr:hypothetical protein NL676_009015 [Syzygium grande]
MYHLLQLSKYRIPYGNITEIIHGLHQVVGVHPRYLLVEVHLLESPSPPAPFRSDLSTASVSLPTTWDGADEEAMTQGGTIAPIAAAIALRGSTFTTGYETGPKSSA